MTDSERAGKTPINCLSCRLYPNDCGQTMPPTCNGELFKGVYDVVLAARTEGKIYGETKYFAEADTEEIIAKVKPIIEKQERIKIFDTLEYYRNETCGHFEQDWINMPCCSQCWQALKEGE